MRLKFLIKNEFEKKEKNSIPDICTINQQTQRKKKAIISDWKL